MGHAFAAWFPAAVLSHSHRLHIRVAISQASGLESGESREMFFELCPGDVRSVFEQHNVSDGFCHSLCY